jgi:hypothetical protein
MSFLFQKRITISRMSFIPVAFSLIILMFIEIAIGLRTKKDLQQVEEVCL